MIDIKQYKKSLEIVVSEADESCKQWEYDIERDNTSSTPCKRLRMAIESLERLLEEIE